MTNSTRKLVLAVAVVSAAAFGWFSCSSTPACDASNCMGCCDSTTGMCVKQTSTAACGINGGTCMACTGTNVQCKAGACVSPMGAGGGTASTGGGSATGGGSGSTGGGSAATGGGSGATGGGTAATGGGSGATGGGTAASGGGSGATGGGTAASGGGSGATGGGCNGTMLTVLDEPTGTPWCDVSVAGMTASAAGTQTVCVPAGDVTLTASAHVGFQLGLWHKTNGDTGSGEAGSVSGNTSTAHFTADGGATACVWVCCPFTGGAGCPTTSTGCP